MTYNVFGGTLNPTLLLLLLLLELWLVPYLDVTVFIRTKALSRYKLPVLSKVDDFVTL